MNRCCLGSPILAVGSERLPRMEEAAWRSVVVEPSPNPRLQRTPLRAPLSRKPLGAAVKNLGRARGESARSGCLASLAAA
jgi:hypothetical protein